MTRSGYCALAGVGFVLWLSYVLIVSFYYPAGGDEPGYFWAARRLAEGHIPVLDYFVITPWATLAPYAAVIRWLSPAWEASRLISVASIAGISLIIGVTCWRAYGRLSGVAAFCLIGFSHFWFSWNIQVNHYPVANFALVAAFAILISGPPVFLRSLLLGVAAGWAVNARFPLMFAALVTLGLSIRWARQTGMSWQRVLTQVILPYGMGGLVVSLPSFYILSQDQEAFFFNYLRFRFEFTDATFMAAESSGDKLKKIFFNRFDGLYGLFFGWFGTETKATYPNLTIIGSLALGILSALAAGTLRGSLRDPRIGTSLLLIAAILFAYAFADMVLVNHLQPILPFMVIVAMGFLHAGGIWAASGTFARLVRGGVAVLVLLTMANFMFWTLSFVVRRAEPSHGKPITVAQVGCWIERNTPAGALVMNYNTLPVTVSGRRVPEGYDYGGNIIALFWGRLNQSKAERFKILSDIGYLDLLRGDAFAYLILDQNHTYYITPPIKPERKAVVEEIGQIIADRFHLIASTGGPFPYRIMVRNGVSGEVSGLRQRKALEVDMRRLFRGDRSDLLRNLGADISRSLSELPPDLSASWQRVINGPVERRCINYLDADRD